MKTPTRIWLARVDSITSLVAHRYAGALPEDVVEDLKTISSEARTMADAITDWCSSHERPMKGVNAHGKWVCRAIYDDSTFVVGQCRLEERVLE